VGLSRPVLALVNRIISMLYKDQNADPYTLNESSSKKLIGHPRSYFEHRVLRPEKALINKPEKSPQKLNIC
jgi:hypothetical protein